MFNRKFSSNIRRKKRMITSIIILLVVFLGIGYSAFTTNLSINGTLGVSKYDHTLYGVLEKVAKKGIYAKEYTGEHHDSFTQEPTKKIYHWWADNDTNGTAILDMNNVIFANHCWQMIRTTDTGGVKLIYNGEPENGQCLNTRGNHVGYGSRTTQSMSTTYYYGTSYTYDKTNNVFSLDGTVTTGTIQPGQYTCKQTSSTGTCATLYLVDTLSSGTTYYAVPLNSNSHYSQFGYLQFNQKENSPAYVGYMYNTVYSTQNDFPKKTEYMISPFSLSTSYWYADSVTWDSTANRYNLVNPYQVSSTSDYSSLVGKYTFNNATQTYTHTSVYYIAAVSNTTMYYIELKDSTNHNLADYNHTYTYGDSYTDNGNGTYTINNPTTISRSDWYTSYSNVSNKYVCKNATNNTCSEIWYETTPVAFSMSYHSSLDNYIYSKNYTWDGTKYSLDTSNMVQFWDKTNSTNLTNINNNHYTCFNTAGECTTISYIYYVGGSTPYYINITNGKSVEDALDEMLYNDNVNTTNSTIKTGIDAWYKRYMTGYTSKLEDTIFCNERSMSDASANGWNPNGGSIATVLYFKRHNSNSDLSCTNTTDKFSLANTKARLTYPVGLLTYEEIGLLNNQKIIKTGRYYWTISPNFHSYNGVYEYHVNNSGGFNGSIVNVSYTQGVRPAVSLKPGTEYASGTGSMADPYVVE